MSLKYPGAKPDTAFCAGVRWSVVIRPTDGRESTRSPRWMPPASRAEAEGVLVLGAPEKIGRLEWIPIYLEARRDLVRVALTFALGDGRSPLHFVAAGGQPSLAHDGQAGVVALAWLDGMTVRAGERLLLGYVEGPAGSLASPQIYGVSASRLDDNSEVLVGPA